MQVTEQTAARDEGGREGEEKEEKERTRHTEMEERIQQEKKEARAEGMQGNEEKRKKPWRQQSATRQTALQITLHTHEGKGAAIHSNTPPSCYFCGHTMQHNAHSSEKVHFTVHPVKKT